MCTHDLSRCRVLLFGAFGNGNLGDMYQALAVRRHLLGIGLLDANIFACSMLDRHEYPFPAERKLPASYVRRTAELNARFSAVVVGGGGLLAHPHEPLEDVQWARSVTIPVVFLGVGANADCTRRSSELLDGALAISGRDRLSLEALAHGTARESFMLRDPTLCVADAASLLEFDPPAHADAERHEPIDVLWILRSPVNDEEALIVQFVLDHIRSDRRRHTVVVAEPGLDAGLKECMPGVQIRQPENLRAFLSLIDRARCIFSMRYHGVIFAALAGKVAYGLSQKSKVECLYTECGLPGRYIDSLDQLAELLSSNQDEQRIATELSRCRNILRLEFIEQMKVIESALSGARPPRREQHLEALCERNLDAYYRAALNRQAAAQPSGNERGFLDQAIEAGLKLAGREAAQVKDWVAVAHLLARADRLDEALVWISHAVAVSPDVTDYCRLQASVLERLHRFEEALRMASHALKLRPGDNKLAADVERISSACVKAMCG
jgi:polysaccharide pyruvyl transferase WcaK-like protein